MKYTHQEGLKTKHRRGGKWLIFVACLGLVVGVYLAFDILRPALPPSKSQVQAVVHQVKSTQPKINDKRIYIPKIAVNTPVVGEEGNLSAALEKGIVEVAPKSGSPASGGNYVLAGHRFDFKYIPKWTYVKSPLYHVNKLSSGDNIYIDYGGKRYAYVVDKVTKVSPTDLSIEQPTKDARLTLYTCQLSGPKSDRIVVEAHPIGTIAWVDGKSVLKAL